MTLFFLLNPKQRRRWGHEKRDFFSKAEYKKLETGGFVHPWLVYLSKYKQKDVKRAIKKATKIAQRERSQDAIKLQSLAKDLARIGKEIQTSSNPEELKDQWMGLFVSQVDTAKKILQSEEDDDVTALMLLM